MGRRRINKNKNMQQVIVKKAKYRMDLGDGYYITYNEKANRYWIGRHYVDIWLHNENEEQPIKKITDSVGNFLEFPGIIEGDWCEKLKGGLNWRIDFTCWISEFEQDISLFSWKVQPDGRYWEDRDFLSEEEIVLYAYMNKHGEFVTPFADFYPKRHMESLETFKNRTNGFMENSMPEGHELWIQKSVKQKVDDQGQYKPFWGNTVVFPLEDEMLDYVASIQKKLECIRKDFEYCQQEAYLAESLEKDTYHITLHDLTSSVDKEEAEEKIKATKAGALRILDKLRKMDFPIIRVEPVDLFAMNGTSVVLGFRAIDEENQKNLMVLYELFQSIVELPYELTPHVTLSYFRYKERHDKNKIQGLRNIIKEVNEQIKRDRKAGTNPIVELDVKQLAYQHFSSMNKYNTIE